MQKVSLSFSLSSFPSFFLGLVKGQRNKILFGSNALIFITSFDGHNVARVSAPKKKKATRNQMNVGEDGDAFRLNVECNRGEYVRERRRSFSQFILREAERVGRQGRGVPQSIGDPVIIPRRDMPRCNEGAP